MEAVPRMPMIHFELKTSPDKPNFEPKLKDYIRYNYNEDAESFSGQISQLEALRATAVRPAHTVNGCNTLKRYYCQLHFLLGRFPMGKGGEAAIEFTWKDPYTEMTSSDADIALEMANILYNNGALHSQLGAGENRTTPEGMKMACSHFQCAAWSFQHIRDEFPQIVNYEASTDLLLFMNQVSLAQAQECLLEKSMMDNRKGSIVAKIAIQTVEYYKTSLKLLNANASDDTSISKTVHSKLRKGWEKYLKFKVSYHSCIDMLYRGQQAEEEQKMGERVAYYQVAFDKLEEAKKLGKGLESQAVNEALQFTQDVVEGKRKAATNENEYIYHVEVPDVNLLPEMKGAQLLKGTGFDVNDPEVSGSDIFGRLIPLTAHETSSIYSEELAKLLRKTTAAILKKEEELDNFVSNLQLDELKAQEDWMLPPDLIDCCAEVNSKPDAIQNLMDAMNTLSETYKDVEAMLSEIRAILQKEGEAARTYEGVVGKQAPTIVATDLTREANKYQDAHNKASESNQTLHKAMKLHLANLRLLSMPPRALRDEIPVIAFDSPEDEAIMRDMQTLMNKVKEMKTQRGMLLGQLREAINRDDITHLVVTFTGENKEQLFQKEIQKHQKQINLIHQNLAAQEKILAAIQEVYPKYCKTRRNVGEKLQRRDGMVASLKASYDAYEDLMAKSNKGLEFYSKLQTNVSKLYQKIKSNCQVLEEEREEMLKTILEDVPKGSIRNRGLTSRVKGSSSDIAETTPLTPSEYLPSDSPPPFQIRSSNTSGGLKLKDYLNMKKETGKMSLVSGSTGSVYNTAGYAPVPSPHLYEAPGSSWVPSAVRPAPVGSEGTDTSANRVTDSDRSSWDPSSQSNWTAAMQKGNSPYHYPTAGTSGQNPYQSGTYPYPYQANQNYPYQGSYSYSATTGTYPANVYPSQNTGANANFSTAAQAVAAPTAKASVQTVEYNAGAQRQVPSQNYVNPQSSQPTSSTAPSGQFPTQQNPYNIGQGYNSAFLAQNAAYGSQVAYAAAYSSAGYGTPIQNTAVSAHTGGSSTSANFNTVVPPSSQYPSHQQTVFSNSPAVSNQTVAYDQQKPSTLTPQSSSTSINSLGTSSSSASQSSLTTAYLDPFVNEPAHKLQAPTDWKYPSATSQQQQPSAVYSSNSGTSVAEVATYNQAQQSYCPTSAYPVNYYGTAKPENSSTTFPNNYSGQNMYQQVSAAYYGNVGSYSATTLATTQPPATYQTGLASSYANTSVAATTLPSTAYSSTYQSGPVGNYANVTTTVSQQASYVPPMGGGYQQAAEYLQYGNASMYTSTLQNPNYSTITSQNYASTPKSLDLKPQLNNQPHSDNPHNNFIPQPAVNTPTQTPATYQVAGFPGQATSTTSSSGNSKSSPSVNSSNVDLLAGLDFEVKESPLVPSNVLKSVDSPKKLTAPSEPTIVKTDAIEEQNKLVPIKKEVEERKMDSEALKAFVPEVDKFEKFVEGLTLKTLNGPTTLELKWKEIADLQEKDNHGRSISVARCYPMKNRFPDILPYDDSRIELPSTKDDYINASLLKPVTSGMLPLILTQAPLPGTYADFWTMVLEQQVEVIVCLLADMEIDKHVYWPTEKGQEMEVGRTRLVLQTCNVRSQWVERIISLTFIDTKISRVIVHLQFTSWPGSSFPPSPAPFLTFVAEARTFLQQQRNANHPVVVHCHSGVGRTGLFCVILAAILDIEAGRGIPDLATYAVNISRSRKNCLRDREHLKFAYQTMLYFCQDLLLKRGILTNKTTFEEKKQKEGKCHTRHPSEDFLVPSGIEQQESKIQNLETDEKDKADSVEAKPNNLTADNLNQPETGKISPLMAAMDPNNFNLNSKEEKSNKKLKFTTENFTAPTLALAKPASDASGDPLSSLDPLWSLKK